MTANNGYLTSYEKEDVLPGDKIVISGYPAIPESFTGHLYTMRGTIFDVIKTDQGGRLILYKDVDTTGGQSGSPVYLIRWNPRTGERVLYLIGIHVGWNPTYQANAATCIDNRMLDWINFAAITLTEPTIHAIFTALDSVQTLFFGNEPIWDEKFP